MPGEWASFGQSILTLVEDDDVWVLAAFRRSGFRAAMHRAIRSGRQWRTRLLAAMVSALGPGDLTAVLDFVLRPVALPPGIDASVLVIAS